MLKGHKIKARDWTIHKVKSESLPINDSEFAILSYCVASVDYILYSAPIDKSPYIVIKEKTNDSRAQTINRHCTFTIEFT